MSVCPNILPKPENKRTISLSWNHTKGLESHKTRFGQLLQALCVIYANKPFDCLQCMKATEKFGQGLRQSFLGNNMTAFCSLSLHPKLAFSAAHVESWSANYDIKNSDFSQLWTASHKCLPQCWKLLSYSLGEKHTHISSRCHCLATRLPNATLVRVCASLSKSIRCLQAKVGTRLSWANWSKMKKKIYEESLQLAQRSCKIESKRMLIYDTDM